MQVKDKNKVQHKHQAPLLRATSMWFAPRFYVPLFVFCWPMVYLFNHLFPVDGSYTIIGNDFFAFYFKYKFYLLDCLSSYHFPLWSPSEGAGFPFYSNPLAQSFYPFNVPLAAWYRLAEGYTVLDHAFFTVLGLSIFALGLYKWLRLTNHNLRAVVFSVLVMSVSFKMTEILRFPNAVHTAAWYPWILYALTKIFFSRSLRDSLVSGSLLAFAAVCLCTAGYPYYLYYSLFLFAPYALIFFIPPLRLRFFGARPVVWKNVLLTLAAAGFVSIVLCGPYLLSVTNLMAQTTNRTGKNFEYSTEDVFNYEDTIGSLVYPPAAQAEGWYFFSITALLIIMLYLLRCNSVIPGKPPDALMPPSLNDTWIKLFFLSWIAVISYITYGRNSQLFVFLWNYMPGFSALRVWGRLNIILVPIIAWLLSIAYASFEALISQHAASIKRPHVWVPIAAAVAMYAVVLSVQIYLYQNKIYDPYWTFNFKNVSAQDSTFILTGIAAFLAILSPVVFLNRIPCKSNFLRYILLAVLVLVATVEMRPVGANMYTYQSNAVPPLFQCLFKTYPDMWSDQSNAVPKRYKLDVARLNTISFNFPRSGPIIENTISLGPSFNTGIQENWYFERYVSLVKKINDQLIKQNFWQGKKLLKETKEQLEALTTLMGVQDGTRIFFSEAIDHASIAAFLDDAARYTSRTGNLVSYTGDELVWKIAAPATGYFSFIDNWDPCWKVFVDGKPSEIELLFGTFKSVKLAAGPHLVRFAYQPKMLFP